MKKTAPQAGLRGNNISIADDARVDIGQSSRRGNDEHARIARWIRTGWVEVYQQIVFFDKRSRQIIAKADIQSELGRNLPIVQCEVSFLPVIYIHGRPGV